MWLRNYISVVIIAALKCLKKKIVSGKDIRITKSFLLFDIGLKKIIKQNQAKYCIKKKVNFIV